MTTGAMQTPTTVQKKRKRTGMMLMKRMSTTEMMVKIGMTPKGGPSKRVTSTSTTTCIAITLKPGRG